MPYCLCSGKLVLIKGLAANSCPVVPCLHACVCVRVRGLSVSCFWTQFPWCRLERPVWNGNSSVNTLVYLIIQLKPWLGLTFSKLTTPRYTHDTAILSIFFMFFLADTQKVADTPNNTQIIYCKTVV